MAHHFTRCCVDLDPAGNPIAWSYEAHDTNDGVVAIGCGDCEPFETVKQALGKAIAAAHRRTGIALPLWSDHNYS